MRPVQFIISIFTFLPRFDLFADASRTEIFDAPDVRVEVDGPSSAFYVSKTNDLRLRCAVRLPTSVRLSEGTKSLVWRFNEEDVVKAGLPAESFRIDGDRLLLKASADAELLVGKYACNVTWPMYGTVLSPPVHVQLASMKKFKNDLPVEERATLGHTAYLPCPAPESHPGPPKIWFVFNGSKELDFNNDRYLLTSTGLYVGRVEASDQGTYVCRAMNPVTGQIRDSKPISLVVLEDQKQQLLDATAESDDVGTARPSPYFNQRNGVDVRRGDNVTLDCVMKDGSGRSVSTVRWERYGSQLPPSEKQTQIFGNLVLYNVTKDDEGTYICRPGTTRDSSGTASSDKRQPPNSQGRFIMYSLRVHVPLKAKLTIERDTEEDDKSAASGVSYRLTCQAASGLASDLEFLVDGRPLLSQPLKPVRTKFQSGESPKWSFTLTESTLRKGVYQCIVPGRGPLDELNVESSNLYIDTSSNEEQSKMSDDEGTTYSVEVDDVESATQTLGTLDFDADAAKKTLPKIKIGPENETATVGSSATFVCQVSSNTEAVYWLKDGQMISDSESEDEDDEERQRKYKRIGTGSLKIEQTVISDRGWYACVAWNSFGNATAKAYLDFDGHVADADDGATNDADATVNGQSTEEAEQSEKKNQRKKKIRLEAPVVFRYSNTSVYLRWRLTPEQRRANSGLRFFKLQYKKLSKGEREKSPVWKTLDQELPSHSHSGTIDGLEPGQKYKFRYAAVYENNDQAVSKMTAAYDMIIERKQQPPKLPPALTSVKAISWSAISLVWDYPTDEQAPVEGFIIMYRRIYYADTSPMYQNETVIGGWTREHVLSHLLPTTLYQIKMVAFNSVGRSRESNMVEENTLKEIMSTDGTRPPRTFDAVMPMDQLLSGNGFGARDVTRAGVVISKPPISANRTDKSANIFGWLNVSLETIFYIIGGLVGALLLSLISFILVCQIRLKKQKKLNSTAKGKYRDASKKIYREQALCNDRSIMKEMYPPISNSASFQHSTPESCDDGHDQCRQPPPSSDIGDCIPPPPSVTGYGNGSLLCRNGVVMNLYTNPLDFHSKETNKRIGLKTRTPDIEDEGDELLSTEERLLAEVYGADCDFNKNDVLFGVRALGSLSNTASINGRHSGMHHRPIPPPLILTAASALTSTGEFGNSLNRSFLSSSSPHASLASNYSSSNAGDGHSSSTNGGGGPKYNYASLVPPPSFAQQLLNDDALDANEEKTKRIPTPALQKPTNIVRPSDSLRTERKKSTGDDSNSGRLQQQRGGVVLNGAASPMSISSHASIGSSSATSANGSRPNFSTFRPDPNKEQCRGSANRSHLLLYRNRLSDGYCSDA